MPSLAISLDESILDALKEPVVAKVLSMMGGMAIPDMEMKGGYIKDNTFKIMQDDIHAVELTTDEVTSALVLTLNKLKCEFFSTNFRMKVSIITVKGKLKVNFSNTTMAAKLKITDQVVDGRHLPAFEIPEAVINIDPKNFDFQVIDGGALGDLTNLLKPII